MSRSQKNVRRVPAGSPKPEGGSGTGMPDGVTKKDGATNIAGDVHAFTADQYTGMVRVTEDVD